MFNNKHKIKELEDENLRLEAEKISLRMHLEQYQDTPSHAVQVTYKCRSCNKYFSTSLGECPHCK